MSHLHPVLHFRQRNHKLRIRNPLVRWIDSQIEAPHTKPISPATTRVAHRPPAYKYRVSPLKVALRPSLTIKSPATLSIQTSRLAMEGRPEAVAHHEVSRHPRPAGSVPLERYVHPVQPARPGPAPDGLRVVAQEGVGGGGGGDRGTGLERRASLITPDLHQTLLTGSVEQAWRGGKQKEIEGVQSGIPALTAVTVVARPKAEETRISPTVKE
jgi:hypothetical protein